VPQCHACAGRIGKFRFALSPPLQRGNAFAAKRGRTERHALSSPIATPKATVTGELSSMAFLVGASVAGAGRHPTRCVQRLGSAVACADGSATADPSRGRIALPLVMSKAQLSTQGEATLPQQSRDLISCSAKEPMRPLVSFALALLCVLVLSACGEMRRIEREQDAVPSAQQRRAAPSIGFTPKSERLEVEVPLARWPSPNQQVDVYRFLQRYKRGRGRLVLTCRRGARPGGARQVAAGDQRR